MLKLIITNINHAVHKRQTPTIADEGLLFWWTHQDLNLGPKDYAEQTSK